MDRRHFRAPNNHVLTCQDARRGLEVLLQGWALSPHHSATAQPLPRLPAQQVWPVLGNFLCTKNAHGSCGWGASHPPPLLLICQGHFFLEKSKAPAEIARSLFSPVHPAPCRQAMPDPTGFIQVPALNLPNLCPPPPGTEIVAGWTLDRSWAN